MTDPKIIFLIKQELTKIIKNGEDKAAKQYGFGGGFDRNTADPTVFVFTGKIDADGEAQGSIMQHNFTFANMCYGKFGFMQTAMRRFREGDVYIVIKRDEKSPEDAKLLLVKRNSIHRN